MENEGQNADEYLFEIVDGTPAKKAKIGKILIIKIFGSNVMTILHDTPRHEEERNFMSCCVYSPVLKLLALKTVTLINGEILLLYYFMFINKHESIQQQNLSIGEELMLLIQS